MKMTRVLGAVALAACAAGGGTVTKDGVKDAEHGGPLPANYRQMFAQYVAAYARAKPNFAVHDAFI